VHIRARIRFVGVEPTPTELKKFSDLDSVHQPLHLNCPIWHDNSTAPHNKCCGPTPARVNWTSLAVSTAKPFDQGTNQQVISITF